MIRAVFLPPMAWKPELNSYIQGESPDPFQLYAELRKQGIDASVSDPFPRPWNPFAGKDTLFESLDPLRALKWVLRQRRADILVSVFEGAAAPLGILRSLGILKIPVCLWDIGLTETWRMRQHIIDITVPRVDGIMVLGNSQERYIRQRWHPKGLIRVVHHRVDTEFFQPQPDAIEGFVLSVGDDIGRDFPTLVEAARGLDREIVIKASRHPPSIPQDVGNVRLMRERLSFRQLRALYARSSVVVVPAHETLNACGVSTILEASAMEKPLVVSDNPAIHDFIIPDETCLVVPRDNPAALRDAVQRLLSDKETSARLATNARNFVTDRFHNSVFAVGLANGIKAIIEHAHQRGR